MMKQLQKVKSLFGYDTTNTEENKEKVSAPTYESNIRKEAKKEVVTCDCCGNTEITIEVTDLFKTEADGTERPLYTQPKVNFENGGIYDDVAICDECFGTCQNETQKQYVWTVGKINTLAKLKEEKEKAIEDNMNLAREIQAEAEARLQVVADETDVINGEINNIIMAAEQLMQEQANIERMLTQM